MRSKLFLVVMVAAVGLVLYYLFTKSSVAAGVPGATSTTGLPLYEPGGAAASGLGSILSSIFGGGASTALAQANAQTATVNGIPINSNNAQIIANAGSLETPTLQYGPSSASIPAQAPVISLPTSYDLGSPLTDTSDITSLAAPGSYDTSYAGDEDSSGDILS